MEDKFNKLREIIGRECIDFGNIKDEEVKLLGKLMNLADQSYIPIQWPDVQEYMDEEWFDEEAILDAECKFGGSAYFIPLKRLL